MDQFWLQVRNWVWIFSSTGCRLWIGRRQRRAIRLVADFQWSCNGGVHQLHLTIYFPSVFRTPLILLFLWFSSRTPPSLWSGCDEIKRKAISPCQTNLQLESIAWEDSFELPYSEGANVKESPRGNLDLSGYCISCINCSTRCLDMSTTMLEWSQRWSSWLLYCWMDG